MAQIKAEYLEREIKRWARPDARNFVRADWRRFVKPGSDAAAVFEVYERKYRQDQARVSPGSREGGQWVDEGANDQNPDARIPQKVANDCELMHKRDLFICRAVQSPACYAQAYLRYTNCQRGEPIPPLNF